MDIALNINVTNGADLDAVLETLSRHGLTATEGGDVDVSISHDPLAPEPESVAGSLDDRYHQDLTGAEQAIADEHDTGDTPGVVVTDQPLAATGDAVNAENGVVTPAGETLPPIPPEASPADAQPTVAPTPEAAPPVADATPVPEPEAQPVPEVPADSEPQVTPNPTPPAESTGATEVGTSAVPGE